ncbi:MAG: polysaccharide biosynthesis C-terminal domain-containing protein [Clostridia bacterium]|nr:polysaccharide biosynthesis C-terminal domain-containing protein [Clostridia bacterium]
MNNARKILGGTLILTAASFLMQTVGVSFNVWLTARLGAEGIGLFQLILTVYNLAVTLGCGGVRLAASRLTVEGQARGENTRKTVLGCVRYALLTGSAAALALFAAADFAAVHWLSDAGSALPLRILALSLPFVAMSSAFNGYFTAVGKVGRYSAVRILEQGVKIGIVALLMARLLPRGMRWGCVAIVAGILLSELFSFLCLHVLYNMEKQMYSTKSHFFSLRGLLHIALPDVSGTGARSVLLTIEHLLIPRGLRRSGASADAALAAYGCIHGMVFPVLLYPSAILTSLAGLLIPELAGRHALGRQGQIASIIRRVLRMTMLFSLGTAGILYAFADGLSQVVYGASDSAFYLRILSVLVPVMYCDMTVDGMLKGLDEQRACMRYNIWDSALCVALVWGVLPYAGMRGYVFILFFSELFNFYFSLRRLCRVSTVELDLAADLFMPLCCGVCAPAFVLLLMRSCGLCAVWGKGVLIFSVAASVALYALLLFGFGCLTAEDAQWFLDACGLSELRLPGRKKVRKNAKKRGGKPLILLQKVDNKKTI